MKTTQDQAMPTESPHDPAVGVQVGMFRKVVPKFDVGVPTPTSWEVGAAYAVITIPKLPNHFFKGGLEGVWVNGELFLRPGEDDQLRVVDAQEAKATHFDRAKACQSPI